MVQHPPYRYGLVASSGSWSKHEIESQVLTRGAYPLPSNLRFLSRLKLKSIVSLTPELPAFHINSLDTDKQKEAQVNRTGSEKDLGGDALSNSDEVDPISTFIAKNSIATFHIRVDKPTDDNEIPLSFKQASQILSIITNVENLPLYIHCLNGGVVTGLVVALLRKLMCWTTKSAIAEYARFLAGEEIDGSAVNEFVERFTGDVEIPPNIPFWLWNGTIPFSRKHPSIRLKYPPQPVKDEKAASGGPGERGVRTGSNSRLTPRMSTTAAFSSGSSGNSAGVSGGRNSEILSHAGESMMSGRTSGVAASTVSDSFFRTSIIENGTVKKIVDSSSSSTGSKKGVGSPATHGDNSNVNAISATLNALDLEM
ncbi:hypothetical protein HDU78_000741 [Chytriomyces hyalinus]|nr:hypothetical protein HDU78_000741 [Chytriomyces hyalinus]KAJ3259505.1 hypothetical protein HDU77_001851 [Chytriomyces hyalinus]